MAVAASRLIARKTLTEVRSRTAFVTPALSHVLDMGDYSDDERGYGSRLAHRSVASYRVTADILARYLRDPDALPPVVHDALVVSATELLYLDAPDHAVDQGVELVKASYPGLAGLANAVLRKIVADRQGLLAESSAYRFGFPPWLADRLIDEYGEEHAFAIMTTSNEEAPIYAVVLSVAPKDWKEQLEDAGAVIESMEGNSIRIHNMGAIRNHRLITSRAILICDVNAQVAQSLAPVGTRMLDVCSGRGSKTLLWIDRVQRHLSEGDAPDLHQYAEVIGIDDSAHKIEVAARQAAQLGYERIEYRVEDATKPGSDETEVYDVVFVDAPCSGIGTLRRHADKRMTLQPADIDELAVLSEKILRTSAQKVASGGVLVYATCTISRKENDDIVAAFLASGEGSRFHLDPIDRSELPFADEEVQIDNGCVQMFPQSSGGDGHFVARFTCD